ncbi:MAG: hypothetical protein AAFN50_04485 [Pseudomonadota bacterium]
MAELLRGYADFLRPGDRQFSGLLFGFSLWLFLALIQFWWFGWRFSAVTTWHFYDLLFYLLGPTILFVLTRLAFPNPTESQDLVAYYSKMAGRLWSLVAAFYVYAIGTNVLLLDVAIWSVGPASQAILVAYAGICSRVENRYLHGIGVVLLITQLLWRGLTSVVAI